MDKLKRLEKLEKALNPTKTKNIIIITLWEDGELINYEKLPNGKRKYYTASEVEAFRRDKGTRLIKIGKASEIGKSI